MKPEFEFLVIDDPDAEVFGSYVCFRHKIQIQKLQEALDISLRRHPLFGKTLKHNEEGVFLADCAWHPHVIEDISLPSFGPGTERPHLFALCAKGKELRLYVAHLLTDGVGINTLLGDILDAYHCLTHSLPLSFSGTTYAMAAEERPVPRIGLIEGAADPDLKDPTGHYFTVKSKGSGNTLHYMTFENGSFMERIRALHTSPSVLTAVLAANTLKTMYPSEERPIYIVIPVNTREMLKSRSFPGNCSCVTELSFDREMLSKPIETQLKEQRKALSVKRRPGQLLRQISYRQRIEDRFATLSISQAKVLAASLGLLNFPGTLMHSYIGTLKTISAAEDIERVISFSRNYDENCISLMECMGEFVLTVPSDFAGGMRDAFVGAGFLPSELHSVSMPVPKFENGIREDLPYGGTDQSYVRMNVRNGGAILLQRFELLGIRLREEEIRLRAQKAVRRYMNTDKAPDFESMDLRNLGDGGLQLTPAQKKRIESYRRLELLRGFNEGDRAGLRLRITLLRVSEVISALLMTCDPDAVSEDDAGHIWDYMIGRRYYELPEYRTIQEMLVSQARSIPGDTAIEYRPGKDIVKISRLQLFRDVSALSLYYQETGAAGKRIAVCGKNSYAWILHFLAAVMTGGSAVLIDSAYSGAEIENRMVRTGTEYIAADQDVLEKMTSSGVRGISLENLSISLRDGYRLLENASCPLPDLSVTAGKEAVVLFSSGSTGHGKAISLTHEQILTNIRGILGGMEIKERALLCLPLYHVSAVCLELLGNIYAGGSIFIAADLQSIFREMPAARPVEILIVPRQAEALLLMLHGLNEEEAEKKTGGLKRISIGGAGCARDYMAAFAPYGIDARGGYGLTEIGGGATMHHWKRNKPFSVQTPVRNMEIRIDRPDGRGRGEILFKGRSVFHGYLDEPDENAAVLKDGWFRTGDIGYLDEDGHLFITGRSKNLILLSNGENVSPEEVEEIMGRSPLIRECMAYGENEQIILEVVPSEDICGEDREIEEKLRQEVRLLNKTLPKYMQAGKIVIRDKPFERNSLGKLLRPG